MHAKELRELSKEELQLKHKDLGKELLDIRLKSTQGQIEKPHRIGQIRRDIARVKTILREQSNAL